MFYPQNVMQDYGRLSGRHTALETALVSAPHFRAHRLRLYRQDIFLLNPNRERIDYLVVKDHIPVLTLLNQPFPSVLMGAAMAAGQPRLVWNTKIIQL